MWRFAYKFLEKVLAAIGLIAAIMTIIAFLSEDGRDISVVNKFIDQTQTTLPFPDLLIRNAELSIAIDEMSKGPFSLKASFVDFDVTFSNKSTLDLEECALRFEYKLTDASERFGGLLVMPMESLFRLNDETRFEYRTNSHYDYRLDSGLYEFNIPKNKDIEKEFTSSAINEKPFAARLRTICKDRISNWYTIPPEQVSYSNHLNFGDWYYIISGLVLLIWELVS